MLTYEPAFNRINIKHAIGWQKRAHRRVVTNVIPMHLREDIHGSLEVARMMMSRVRRWAMGRINPLHGLNSTGRR